MTTNFDTLVVSIADTSHYFQEQAQKQVNVALLYATGQLVFIWLSMSNKGKIGQIMAKSCCQNWRLPCAHKA